MSVMPRALSTSVAGNERATDEGAEDDSESQDETRTAMSDARKSWPGEVCQGGTCGRGLVSGAPGRSNREQAHLGSEEFVKDGKDRLVRHTCVADRERDPPRTRFGLALEAEALEKRNELGCRYL